jgi:hypothetical protein
MSITLGVFDIFTYAVPGSLYLTLLAYISARLGWIDLVKIFHTNTTFVLIAAALGCYLVGHISYPLGRMAGRIVPGWRKNMEDARREFVARVPSAKGRPFLLADRSILQAAVEVRQESTALEIIRLRAVGLMLRNSAPAFILGSVVALSEIVASRAPWFAACCFVTFLLAAAGSLWQSAILTHWANMKTLDLSFWIPNIDKDLNGRDTP